MRQMIERPPALSRWTFSRAKLYGGLTGLFLAAFGGLMSAAPVGAILGVPVAVVGLAMCLSFAVATSGTTASRFLSFPLVLGGLALLIFGRRLAPVDQIIESIRVGREVIRTSDPASAFGIPLMLIGTAIVGTVVPWVRLPRPLGSLRSFVAMVLIQTATALLLVGAVLTAAASPLDAQPHWIWVTVPLAFALGVGLRTYWKGFSWVLIAALTGATLPLTWTLLT